MHQKGFAHLLLIAIIGVFLVAGYFAYTKGYIQVNPNNQTDSMNYVSPTPIAGDTTITPKGLPDETARWNVYTNKTMEYSFKYPLNWNISTKVPNGVKEYASISDPTLSDASSPVFAVQLLDRSFESEIEKIRTSTGSEEETAEVSGGILAKKYVGNNDKGPGPKFVYLILPLKTQSILIVYTPEQEDDDFTTIVNTILSTFKFTN